MVVIKRLMMVKALIWMVDEKRKVIMRKEGC